MRNLSYSTSLIDPFGIDIDLAQGAMEHATTCVVRRASDMSGYYADEAALQTLIAEQNDPVHYEVEEMSVPEENGHLMYAISRLYPGRVGDECFLTKGHYHTKVDTGEIYLCLRGRGFMMMKTSDGAWKAAPMARGRMVYVPPYWAHRSINTSEDEPLVSFCVYPADAGHNYGDIVSEGFPRRVFIRDGEETIE